MKKQLSITRPEFSGPPLPEGRLFFLPFLPSGDLPRKLAAVAARQLEVRPGRLYYLKKNAVLCSALGAPASIMALEKMRNLGLREIYLLSYCGSLSPELAAGQAFLPLKALSQEGTSRHYARPRAGFFFPSPKLLKSLKNFLDERKLAFSQGTIVSTDAPYRETALWLQSLQKKKIMAVDMEMSAVLSFAEFYRLRSAGLFIVSDELFSGQWKNRSRSQPVLKATASYFYPLIFAN
ncbi:MAG: nucleoside phosphorylase [Candidatus Saccharicenans sp.]